VLVLAVIIGIGSTLFAEFTSAIPGEPTIEDALAIVLASLTPCSGSAYSVPVLPTASSQAARSSAQGPRQAPLCWPAGQPSAALPAPSLRAAL
jgi:hypothetical protein